MDETYSKYRDPGRTSIPHKNKYHISNSGNWFPCLDDSRIFPFKPHFTGHITLP
jgi:hypothetical protein